MKRWNDLKVGDYLVWTLNERGHIFTYKNEYRITEIDSINITVLDNNGRSYPYVRQQYRCGRFEYVRKGIII